MANLILNPFSFSFPWSFGFQGLLSFVQDILAYFLKVFLDSPFSCNKTSTYMIDVRDLAQSKLSITIFHIWDILKHCKSAKRRLIIILLESSN